MDFLTIIGICIGIAFLLVAYFAGIEVAFTSANRLNIELKKKQGASSGILLSNLFDNPSRFIGTNVVGFSFFLTIVILLGSEFWNEVLNWYKMDFSSRSFITFFRLIVEIILSWLIIILLGECIPKAIFKAKSDSLLSFSARIGLLGLFDSLFYWIAAAFVKLSIFILNVIFDMRIDKRKEPFSRSDLDHFFQQTNENNSDSAEMNTELFENALSLPKIKVRECLVPRKEIEAIELNMTVEDARKKFIATKLSKLIVYGGNIDQILGYIHQLDLFKQPDHIKEILLPIPAIPESMSATDLINKFTRERKSIAWVVDEFGGTAGIVTMEDLLEEIFGEIKDEYDVEEFEEKMISEDEYILSGRLELDYLVEKYKLEFPENDSETLSGFIIHQHETIPRLKERIIIGNYEFEILNVSDTRIEMVRLKILK
ncbi:hemolysin family protein [Longitalea arenae]|uniref:hemolysin family protein n=1 Tax=Longitalea arenae TaxID=2812558 RepID=UPI001967FA74|nr:hemolysin family protein [Longitalea arenae]